MHDFILRILRTLYLIMRTRTRTSTRLNLKFLRVLTKNIQPGKLLCSIFTRKISAVIFIREGLALSRLEND